MNNAILVSNGNHSLRKKLENSFELDLELINASKISLPEILITLRELNNSELAYKFIFITLNCKNDILSNFSFELSALIRISPFLKKLCSKPIFIISPFSKEYNFAHYNCYSLYDERNRLVQIVEYDEFYKFSPNKTEISIEDIDINNWRCNLNLQSPPREGRHALTNEWAILRLSYILNINFNESLLLNNFKVLSNLYLAKLFVDKEFYNEKINIKDSGNSYNYLIIDDKSSLGWFNIFETILKRINDNNNLFAFDLSQYEQISQELLDEIIKTIKAHKIKLVFLDIRLFDTEEDLELGDLDLIDNLSGVRILKKIKEKLPYVSIIATTASQQALLSKEFLEMGVDYFFLKESPLNVLHKKLFAREFKSLCEHINSLSSKANELEYYFSKKEDLKRKLDLLLKKDEKLNIKRQNEQSNIKSRIFEKLDLGFSLLRSRRFEYDEKFIYSDHQFAFIVFWSIINEFEKGYINKKINENKELEKITSRISGKVIFNGNSNLFTKEKSENLPKIWVKHLPYYEKIFNYVEVRDTSTKVDKSEFKYFSGLTMLLIPSYIYHHYKTDQARELIDDFITLREVRNHLDLTHPTKYIIENKSVNDIKVNDYKSLTRLMFDFISNLLTLT